MPNKQQNNEIKHINKVINSLQDLLKENEKWVNANRKNTSKKRAKDKCFSNQKMQNIVKNIFQSKIKQIKKNANILQNTLAHIKKKKEII